VSGDGTSRRLRELHESYADRVNRLLEVGREDLAMELADAYAEEALRLIVASERKR
jgi:predicted AAA+ superfamily ATPase